MQIHLEIIHSDVQYILFNFLSGDISDSISSVSSEIRGILFDMMPLRDPLGAF